jgi:hypothetical protein
VIRLPRALHRWYANVFGYFWSPCPLCGEMFGGHEWKESGGKPASIPFGRPGIRDGICPACTKAGRGVDTSMTT